METKEALAVAEIIGIKLGLIDQYGLKETTEIAIISFDIRADYREIERMSAGEDTVNSLIANRFVIITNLTGQRCLELTRKGHQQFCKWLSNNGYLYNIIR